MSTNTLYRKLIEWFIFKFPNNIWAKITISIYSTTNIVFNLKFSFLSFAISCFTCFDCALRALTSTSIELSSSSLWVEIASLILLQWKFFDAPLLDELISASIQIKNPPLPHYCISGNHDISFLDFPSYMLYVKEISDHNSKMWMYRCQLEGPTTSIVMNSWISSWIC